MRNWIKALLGGALACGPGIALAAIDNTHHDVPYITANAITERCAACHAKTEVSGSVAGLGKIGGFCVAVCHIQGSAVQLQRAEAAVESPGVFNFIGSTTGVYSVVGGVAGPTGPNALLNGHGLNKSAAGGLIDLPYGAGEVTAVAATGWPYTLAASTRIECTSCHAVHDATNPPFLNARLSDGTQTGGFCQRCHNAVERQQDFAAGAGNHPIEFTWSVTAAATRGQAAAKTDTTRMNDREIWAVGTIANKMPQGITNASAAGALNALGANWSLGGHVVNPTTGLPTDGLAGGANQFGCFSCHPVHASQSATGEAGDKLLIGDTLQTACFGCHTLEPGMTNYGHPIWPEVPVITGITTSWGAVPLTAAYSTIQNPIYRPTALTEAPYCVSCHAVHGGKTGRMAIRNRAGDGVNTLPALNADGAVCELCHASSYTNPTAANMHHPGATGTNYNTANGFAINMGWVTSDGLGDLDDGLSCPDCHIGDGRMGTTAIQKRATAHNWQ